MPVALHVEVVTIHTGNRNSTTGGRATARVGSRRRMVATANTPTPPKTRSSITGCTPTADTASAPDRAAKLCAGKSVKTSHETVSGPTSSRRVSPDRSGRPVNHRI